MAPALAQFEQQYSSQVQMIEIDVDQTSTEAYQKYQSMKGSEYIPETAVLKGGKVVARKVGEMSVEELAQMMELGK